MYYTQQQHYTFLQMRSEKYKDLDQGAHIAQMSGLPAINWAQKYKKGTYEETSSGNSHSLKKLLGTQYSLRKPSKCCRHILSLGFEP